MTEETTTIHISKINKRRLDSILKKGESYDFGMTLLLAVFARPKLGAGGALGPRVVYPLFDPEEMEAIYKVLREHATGEPLKTTKEIQNEIEEEQAEEEG